MASVEIALQEVPDYYWDSTQRRIFCGPLALLGLAPRKGAILPFLRGSGRLSGRLAAGRSKQRLLPMELGGLSDVQAAGRGCGGNVASPSLFFAWEFGQAADCATAGFARRKATPFTTA